MQGKQSQTPETQIMKLKQLLADGNWHFASACIRAMGGFRLGPVVQRLRKQGHEIHVQVNKGGGRVSSAYRMVS